MPPERRIVVEEEMDDSRRGDMVDGKHEEICEESML